MIGFPPRSSLDESAAGPVFPIGNVALPGTSVNVAPVIETCYLGQQRIPDATKYSRSPRVVVRSGVVWVTA
jgi:hypothetical protein